MSVVEGGSPTKLKRVLGMPSLFAVAVGAVVAQIVLVSILQGVGIGGATFFVAIFLAFLVTLCYIFTFSELSLMMPKAGSICAYTEVSIGNFPAIVSILTGYLGPLVLGLPAELFLLELILDTLYPDTFSYIGLIVIFILAFFNFFGVDFFSKVQNILSYLMILSLLMVGIVGLNHSDPQGQSFASISAELSELNLGVFSLTMLAIWAFMAIEFVCPLVEETKKPEKNIPRSMILSAIVLLVVYLIISLAAYLMVNVEELAGTDIPHYIFVNAVFGDAGKLILAIMAITATCSTINTVMGSNPRLFYGMAKNGQLPAVFKKLNPQTNTPWVGLLLVTTLLAVPLMLFRELEDVILTFILSAASLWLLCYIVAHINLIVLRNRYPDFPRPFKSPLYPIPQIVGIISMTFMIIYNSPSPEMTLSVYLSAGVILAVASAYTYWWVKFVMKKDLFAPVPIESVLEN